MATTAGISSGMPEQSTQAPASVPAERAQPSPSVTDEGQNKSSDTASLVAKESLVAANEVSGQVAESSEKNKNPKVKMDAAEKVNQRDEQTGKTVQTCGKMVKEIGKGIGGPVGYIIAAVGATGEGFGAAMEVDANGGSTLDCGRAFGGTLINDIPFVAGEVEKGKEKIKKENEDKKAQQEAAQKAAANGEDAAEAETLAKAEAAQSEGDASAGGEEAAVAGSEAETEGGGAKGGEGNAEGELEVTDSILSSMTGGGSDMATDAMGGGASAGGGGDMSGGMGSAGAGAGAGGGGM